MRKVPLVPVALVLLAAMTAAHLLPSLSMPFWLTLTAVGCLLGGGTLVWRPRAALPVAIGLAFFTAGIGGLTMHRADPRHDQQHWSHLDSHKVYLDVRLDETPVPVKRSFRARATVQAVDGRPRHGDITLFLRNDSSATALRLGDRLLLHGYPDTMHRSLYITSDHYLVIGRDSTSLRARVEGWRMRLLHRMQAGPLERRYSGVAEAMTLGWRGDLDAGMQAAFRDSGIIHLLCVSGLHVGLLAYLVSLLLFWVGKEQKGRIISGSIQLVAVWGFTVLTGTAPATLRAALMFSLFIVSNMLARRTAKGNLLAASAIVMLMCKPLLLLDTGWQLSYAAVAGILLARPVIGTFRSRLLQAATVSTAATVATLPIITATFHRLPLYFLVANIIVVPAASLLLLLSLCYMALPCRLFAWPLGMLLQGTDSLTRWVASLPHAVMEGVTLHPWGLLLVAAAALLILLGAHYLVRQKKNKTI